MSLGHYAGPEVVGKVQVGLLSSIGPEVGTPVGVHAGPLDGPVGPEVGLAGGPAVGLLVACFARAPCWSRCVFGLTGRSTPDFISELNGVQLIDCGRIALETFFSGSSPEVNNKVDSSDSLTH